MSSILDALKKLEKESSGNVPVPSSPTGLDAREVFARPAAARIRWRMLTAALSALVLCGFIAVMIRWVPAMLRPDAPPAAPPSYPEDPPPVGRPIPAAPSGAAPRLYPAVTIAPEPPIDAAQAAESIKPGVEPPTELTAVFHPAPPALLPETGPPAHAEYIGPPTMDAPALSGEAEMPALIRPDPVFDPVIENRFATQKTDDILFREDVRVAIQALVWASEVSQRMAVINDRICKIGDQIAGTTVLDIGEDYVELDDGSVRWRQRFSVK